ncbi:MAG: FAD-dependent thymidylate synthase [bacterium]
MLEVKLAGYNADADILEKLKKSKWDGKNNISPETISAAYARISRDSRRVDELRADSLEEVDKARKSNEAIVFKMGHHSVAEHAYLNFDILGLSRLAVESLQEARLCSYTEKSQRYITLEGDYVTPQEFGVNEKKIFNDIIAKQVVVYKQLFPILHEHRKNQYPEQLQTKSGQNLLEGWAKEDARYALALATECQLGFSSNSRNLEHIIRKLKYYPLAEVRQLGEALYNATKQIVPSLIILSDPEAFKKQFGKEVSDGLIKTGASTAAKAVKAVKIPVDATKQGKFDVMLVDWTKDPDMKIIAAMMQAYSGRSYEAAIRAARKMSKTEIIKFYKTIFKDLGEHDSLYREFEDVNFVYEISLSSSAFAQLKRHRMMSISKQPYDIKLGYTMPPSIIETKQQDIFKKVIDETEVAYKKIAKTAPQAAEYILTNAHKRRVLVNANLRELYHITRLRMDWHAQWDIQNISAQMAAVTKEVAPLSAALACGKDKFQAVKAAFFKARKSK